MAMGYQSRDLCCLAEIHVPCPRRITVYVSPSNIIQPVLVPCNVEMNLAIVKVDKKAVIRNRYNQISHSAPDTKRERNTNN